jgi:PhnB protein
MTMKLNPYLSFNGTAEKAIKHYERALGAKTESMMRFGEAPGSDTPPESKNLIMHAMLQLGEGVLMISDCPPGEPVVIGNQVSVTLHFDDKAEMPAKFSALAEGGQILLPLQDMFWGAHFGMLTDPYGINWLFNCDAKKS